MNITKDISILRGLNTCCGNTHKTQPSFDDQIMKWFNEYNVQLLDIEICDGEVAEFRTTFMPGYIINMICERIKQNGGSLRGEPYNFGNKVYFESE